VNPKESAHDSTLNAGDITNTLLISFYYLWLKSIIRPLVSANSFIFKDYWCRPLS